MQTDELQAILQNHSKWLTNSGGERADLSSANLSSANLSGADLRSANLWGANLSGADLRSANLWGANLSSANLSGADLRSANLWGANLSSANLWGANLSSANLRGADLSSANLWGANLSSANLSGADLRSANLSGADLSSADLRSANLRGANQDSQTRLPAFQLPAGELIVFKKTISAIVTLRIDAHTPRTATLIGRKCRAAAAFVLAVSSGTEAAGMHDGTIYRVNETVIADGYDDNPCIECTHGIHFFLTREEAEAY